MSSNGQDYWVGNPPQRIQSELTNLSPEAQASYEAAIAHLPDYADDTGLPTGDRDRRIAECIQKGILPADFQVDPAEVQRQKTKIKQKIIDALTPATGA